MSKRDGTTRVRPYRPLGADADASRPCLEGLGGSLAGRLFPMREGTTLIGRSCPGHIDLDDDGVSRRHAKIVVAPDGMATLFDLESTNGTFVNGARVTRIALREGDRIQAGPTAAFRFGYRAAAEPRAAQPQEPPEPDGGLRAPSATGLTVRELEIARLVAEGLSNDEIGARLFLSSRTVGTHLANIYKRLEIHSRAALTRFVLERGLLGSRSGD
jgi:DNA-binding CsgD family transcriptional regulator